MWKYNRVKEFVEVNSESGCKLITSENDYINMEQNIEIQCICGEVFTTQFRTFKNSNKRKCELCRVKLLREKYKYSFEYVKLYIEKEGYTLLSNNYINCKTPLIVKCTEGHIFTVIFDSFKNQGSRCKICAGLNVKTTDEFKKEVFMIHNNSITVCGNYTNAKEDIKYKCNVCNNIWEASPDSILRGSGCPSCCKSKGEKRIEKYLINNTIYFESQKQFENLIGLGNGKLSYDFYLPDYNLLIEFQGEQHECFCKGFHKSKKDFEKQQKHDRRKKEYAINQNINLLEIWYYDFDNIENILSKIL